jgi:hypothetical protein
MTASTVDVINLTPGSANPRANCKKYRLMTAGIVHVTNLTPGSQCNPTDRLEAFTSAADAAGYSPAVVLMPSVRDATHDAVFPQPPLLADGAVEAPRSAAVVCAPNPGTFTVNGRDHCCWPTIVHFTVLCCIVLCYTTQVSDSSVSGRQLHCFSFTSHSFYKASKIQPVLFCLLLLPPTVVKQPREYHHLKFEPLLKSSGARIIK